jgi:hypothetical protein
MSAVSGWERPMKKINAKARPASDIDKIQAILGGNVPDERTPLPPENHVLDWLIESLSRS